MSNLKRRIYAVQLNRKFSFAFWKLIERMSELFWMDNILKNPVIYRYDKHGTTYQQKRRVKVRSNFDPIIIERTINPNTLATHKSIFRMSKVRFQRMSQISKFIIMEYKALELKILVIIRSKSWPSWNGWRTNTSNSIHTVFSFLM